MPPSQRRQKTIGSWIDNSIAAHGSDVLPPDGPSSSHVPWGTDNAQSKAMPSGGQTRSGTTPLAQWLLQQQLHCSPGEKPSDLDERPNFALDAQRLPLPRHDVIASDAALRLLTQNEEAVPRSQAVRSRDRGDVYCAAEDPWTTVPLYHSHLTLDSVRDMFRESLEEYDAARSGVRSWRSEADDRNAGANGDSRHDGSSVDHIAAPPTGLAHGDRYPSPGTLRTLATTAAGGGGGIANAFPAEKLMLQLAARGAVSSQALLEYMAFRPGHVVVLGEEVSPQKTKSGVTEKPAPTQRSEGASLSCSSPRPQQRHRQSMALAQRPQQQCQQPSSSSGLLSQKHATAVRSIPSSAVTPPVACREACSSRVASCSVLDSRLPFDTATGSTASAVQGISQRASVKGTTRNPLAASWGPVMGCRWRWDRSSTAHPSDATASDATFGWQDILP